MSTPTPVPQAPPWYKEDLGAVRAFQIETATDCGRGEGLGGPD